MFDIRICFAFPLQFSADYGGADTFARLHVTFVINIRLSDYVA